MPVPAPPWRHDLHVLHPGPLPPGGVDHDGRRGRRAPSPRPDGWPVSRLTTTPAARPPGRPSRTRRRARSTPRGWRATATRPSRARPARSCDNVPCAPASTTRYVTAASPATVGPGGTVATPSAPTATSAGPAHEPPAGRHRPRTEPADRDASAAPTAPTPAHPHERVVRMAATSATFRALGTTTFVAVRDPRELDLARQLAEQVLRDVDEVCSRFREDSDLSRVNARPGPLGRGRPVAGRRGRCGGGRSAWDRRPRAPAPGPAAGPARLRP